MTLRVVFMGTPDFAVPTLAALHSRFNLVGVVTQPDRPQGRGRKTLPSPVKAAALRLGVPVEQPERVRTTEAVDTLGQWAPDVVVVAAYGEILPRSVLDLPPMGCVNLHASLLPRHRGASPISAAILAGDETTGVCTILMDEGMDTGDLLLTREIRILPGDTTGSLHDRMLEPGADLVVRTLTMRETEGIRPVKQDDSQATYTRPLTKEDGRIDWSAPAEHLDRLVRAMNPWPVAFTALGGDMIKIWQVSVEPGQAPQGTMTAIRPDGILVGTGEGLLLVQEVQAPGKKRVSATDFARGRRLTKGNRFG
ncbi:MAG: methionyl-tRNA formyltransferase [Thermodesulfobacteriota bacterium]